MLSFTDITTCRLRRFVAHKYYKILKADEKNMLGWWMFVSEEEQDNEDNVVFENPWPLLVPDGYVDVDVKKNICKIKNSRCWALRLDLEKVAITFSEKFLKNNILSSSDVEYFDYNFFKTIFRVEDL